MKLFNLFSVLVLTICSQANAVTIQSKAGDLYEGKEYVNEQATGKACYLYIDNVSTNLIGNHCYDVEARFATPSVKSNIVKDGVIVQSHITNAHRPEYPAIKTCATNLRGETSGNDIYSMNDENLFNSLFSWAGENQDAQYDFFITFSAESKKPSRVRLHELKTFSENNYDCLF